MKLFRVVFETDVMILANDEHDAIRNAQYYVKDEDPAFMYSDPVETINELNAHPKWKGAIPYSADKPCEDFVL
jgi:hypothetical protein